MPKVLIADELSPRALEIFRTRGVEVDVSVGLKKPDLLKIIARYDGLAVRSATKADKDVIAASQYAKRQLTWFRKYAALDWIEIAPANPVDGAVARIAQKLEFKL